MAYLLALDQGTTSSRAILFDESGKIAGVSQREFGQIYPRPGLVEHDAEEIWQTQLAVAEQVIQTAGLTSGDIAAIGITNQRETIVVWDRETGEPIQNAIVWQDRRTAEFCDQLKADGCETMINQKTGLVIDPYFSASKLRWILDNAAGGARSGGEWSVGCRDDRFVARLAIDRRRRTCDGRFERIAYATDEHSPRRLGRATTRLL